MAAVYYLGCKAVSTKKGDRIVAYFLCHDSYHSPAIRNYWLEKDSDIANSVLELKPGVAVRCEAEFGNERALVYIEENGVPPVLDLTAFLDMSIN